jgi:hypothetical protein
MASLILQSFKCVEETDEVGSDSPYFVIFHGDPTNPSAARVRKVRKQAWDGTVDSGETVQANSTVVGNGVSARSVVLAAFMEEDNDSDISAGDLTAIENHMRTVFTAFSASGTAPLNLLTMQMTMEFIKALIPRIENDDLCGLAPLKITNTAGLLPALRFTGDGGDYRVQFKTQ